MEAKLINDAEIAKAKRDYELQKAGYDTEVSEQHPLFHFVITEQD